MKNKIILPRGAWYGDLNILYFAPSGWQVESFSIPGPEIIADEAIAASLFSLKAELENRKPDSVLIVADDLTRPVSLERILGPMLNILHKAGLSDGQISFLIGLGSHKALNAEMVAKKLGEEAAGRYRWFNHNPEETEETEVVWGQNTVKLNKHYLAADFRIVISGLTPHSFAGFSGGAKMLFPGLADMQTIARTHKSVLMGFMGQLGETANNKFRNLIEDFTRRVGLEYFVGVVINGDRSIHHIETGDFVEAHRRAAEIARKLYLQTGVADKGPFDLVIINAYPKDSELLQAENAFIPLKSATRSFLKENTVVLLTSECSEGLGHHGLFDPEGMLYRPPKPLNFLKGKQLVFFSDSITAQDFYKVYHEQDKFFSDWDDLVEYLSGILPENPKVAVFPQASLQLTE